ncbi:hypothetical protein B0H14DRAFT_2522815 [Mycena olivaceomarginata]|nr:hypothetical protein B0H14DRAFT_2522815 [Mycena olivaceomarginata]
MPGNPLLQGGGNTANNSRGNNGADNGTWPEEDIIKGLSLRVCPQFQLPRHPHRKVARRTWTCYWKNIVEKAECSLRCTFNDPNNYRGPETVKHNLAMAGFKISRRIVRETMWQNDPDSVDAQYPGRKKIKRAQLKAHGTWQEVHCDGHEKLGALALQMGGVGLPIYGMKDKWGSEILYLVVVPDDRHADAIGHVFLDFIETYGAIPQQTTTDKGSETGYIYAFTTGLKTVYAPNIDLARYPASVALKSTNNTPIESLWHWFQDQCGKNLFHITKGRDEGIFNPNNPIHVHLFNWIWPPIVQGKLDHFTERWNSHVIRHQRNKLMPSGVSPNELYAHPEYYGGRCFAIPVPQAALDAFRASIRLSRDAALSWVPAEFDVIATQVYELLGSPMCSAETAWDLFSKMSSVMR